MRKFRSGDFIRISKDIKVVPRSGPFKGKKIGKLSKKKAYKIRTVREFPEQYKLLELPEKYIIYIHHEDVDVVGEKL